MDVFTGIASFRAANDSRPFIIHIGKEEYVAIYEAVLCTRFRFLESTLLVEREELNENGSIVRTVYVRPISTDHGLQFRVGAGRYSIMGAHLNWSSTIISSFTTELHFLRSSWSPIGNIPIASCCGGSRTVS